MERSRSLNLRHLVHNWLSLFGFFLALVFLVGEIVIISIDLLQGGHNAYVGILIYIVGPAIVVFGLMLVPLGMLLEHHRRKKGFSTASLPVIDLNNPLDRKYLAVFLVISSIFLAFTMVGSYQAYHVTESNQFCGLMCHQVMIPEYTTYQSSPHARVDCVQCHIGPGADWYVKSKLSGARQVWKVMTNTYELPLETPIDNLRPARDTCEQCHWPEKFYEAVEKRLVYYGSDEENTPYRLDLLLHVGSNPIKEEEKQQESIHWHIGLDHKLEYYARDEDRLDIPWIRITYDDGRVEEFLTEVEEGSEEKPFDPATIPADQIRTMDCIDCHNRPSHQYHSAPFAVNEAFRKQQLDPKLPDLKAILVELLQTEYETTGAALETIETEIRSYYEEFVQENPVLKDSVDAAVAQSHQLFQRNFFPEWKTDWSKFPSHIGHYEFPGCYRCHDDKHKSSTGKTITNDCNLCHTIIRQGEGWEEITNLEYKSQSFIHPRGYGDDWQGQNCHECHGPGMM